MKSAFLQINRILVMTLVICLFCVSQAFPSPQSIESQSVESTTDATIVRVGIWLVDIDSIDSAAQSFVANFFVTLNWNDTRLTHKDQADRIFNTVDVWTPNLQIVNEIGRVRTTLPEVVHVKQDGSVTYRQRYVGSFSQALNLYKFPFDEQLFRLHFIRTGRGNEKIEFVIIKIF